MTVGIENSSEADEPLRAYGKISCHGQIKEFMWHCYRNWISPSLYIAYGKARNGCPVADIMLAKVNIIFPCTLVPIKLLSFHLKPNPLTAMLSHRGRKNVFIDAHGKLPDQDLWNEALSRKAPGSLLQAQYNSIRNFPPCGVARPLDGLSIQLPKGRITSCDLSVPLELRNSSPCHTWLMW